MAKTKHRHEWTHNIKETTDGKQTQYRRCDICHLWQRHIVNQKTGKSEGWKTIG